MNIYSLLNLELRTDLGGILSENLHVRDKLVRPICKFTKSVTKTNSKVQESKTYDKAISDLIHGYRW